MKTNIPVYRAKKIDSDKYVMGLVCEAMEIHSVNKDLKPLLRLWIWNKDGTYEIDPSTLAIHFSDMIDSEGSEIFASLSKDGNGGSICTDSYNEKYICILNTITHSFCMMYYTIQDKKEFMGVYDTYWKTFKVTGIQS